MRITLGGLVVAVIALFGAGAVGYMISAHNRHQAQHSSSSAAPVRSPSPAVRTPAQRPLSPTAPSARQTAGGHVERITPASPAHPVVAAPTPTPPGVQHCYLEVRNISDANEIRRIWQTDWGSYSRDRFQRTILHMRVGTTGRFGGLVKVDWYFVGREGRTKQLVVYGNGSQRLQVPAAYFAECNAAAPILKSHDTRLVLANRRYQTGAIHNGWIVSVTNDKGQLLDTKASSESLLKLFQTGDAFAQLPRINPR